MSAEIWETYRDLKAERTEKKRKRREEFARRFDNGELDPEWERHHDTHYSRSLLGHRLDYWPGPKKWRWKNRVWHGDVVKFIRRAEGNADGHY